MPDIEVNLVLYQLMDGTWVGRTKDASPLYGYGLYHRMNSLAAQVMESLTTEGQAIIKKTGGEIDNEISGSFSYATVPPLTE